MKKVFVLGFIFVLFCFSLVAAASCDDSQTIMRLYSSTNSHVSAWNESVSSYPEKICYNDIFGFAYDGTNPHNCNGLNRVLSLSGYSNSHASETTDNNYNYEVCYGDLNCIYDTSGGNSCDSKGQQVVARLHYPSNTHVSAAADSNYPIKVCCTPTDSTYWTDMNGQKITHADYGDTVRLIAKGMDSGNFEIMEKDLIGSDYIRTINNGKNIPNGRLGIWTITKSDLDKTNDYKNFYFNINGEKSSELVINPSRNNYPMNITLISPTCGSYFDGNTNFSIKVFANDSDGAITGKVKINEKEVNFTNGGISFNQSISSGNVQVIVEASSTSGERSRVISNIMVLDKKDGKYVDGKYVAACITKPKDLSNIYSNVVDFDASSTRAIKITNGIMHLLVPDNGDTFSWYWRFMPDNMVRNFVDTTKPIAYRFPAEFNTAGDNSASLRVEIN